MPNETTPACDVAKSLWKQLLDADADSCNPDCDDQTRAPVALLEKALADARREGEEAEAKRWQDAIDDVVYAEDDERDGSGCDSGDPLDVCLTEIQGAFNVWHNRLHDQGLRLIGKGRAAKIAPEDSNILDPSGQVRRVLGTLPITKDGFVIGDKCHLFYHGCTEPNEFRPCYLDENGNWNEAMFGVTWYSTAEAALSAKEPRP